MNRRSKGKGRTKSKKTKKFGLLQISLAIVIILGLIFISVRPNFDSKPNKPARVKSGIQFTKEGELSFIKYGTQSVVETIDLEIADNLYERTRGLMDRYTMKNNQGMLFIMDREEPQSFWMKDTFISLDIIFLDKDFKIVSIAKYTQPQSTLPIISEKNAKYIVEVVAGYTDKHNIVVGDSISYKRN